MFDTNVSTIQDVVDKYTELVDLGSEYSYVISRIVDSGINDGEPLETLMQKRDRINEQVKELLEMNIKLDIKPMGVIISKGTVPIDR